MFTKDKLPLIEEIDQCNTCEHAKGEIDCPLMQGLGYGYIHLDPCNPIIECCKFYKKEPLKKIRRIK
jgi:hypothetical protein